MCGMGSTASPHWLLLCVIAHHCVPRPESGPASTAQWCQQCQALASDTSAEEYDETKDGGDEHRSGAGTVADRRSNTLRPVSVSCCSCTVALAVLLLYALSCSSGADHCPPRRLTLRLHVAPVNRARQTPDSLCTSATAGTVARQSDRILLQISRSPSRPCARSHRCPALPPGPPTHPPQRR